MFAVNKLKRLYGWYIVSVLVSSPVLVKRVLVGDMTHLAAIKMVTVSLVLHQAWFPSNLLLNGPTWALSSICFFYLWFPRLSRLIRGTKHLMRWGACTLVVGILPGLLYNALQPDCGGCGTGISFSEAQQIRPTGWIGVLFQWPLFRVSDFVAGIFLRELSLQKGALRAEYHPACFAIAVMAFYGVLPALFAKMPIEIAHQGLSIIPCAMLLYLAGATKDLEAVPSLFAGSFGLYLFLFQAPLASIYGFTANVIMNRANERSLSVYADPVHSLIAMISILCFSAVVEKTTQNAINRRVLTRSISAQTPETSREMAR